MVPMRAAYTTVAVIGAIAVAYAALVITHSYTGDGWLPQPINVLILFTIGLGWLAAVNWLRSLKERERRQLDLEAFGQLITRQHQITKTALVGLGARIEDHTGELCKLADGGWRFDSPASSHLSAYDRGYADGLARAPMAGKVSMLPTVRR